MKKLKEGKFKFSKKQKIKLGIVLGIIALVVVVANLNPFSIKAGKENMTYTFEDGVQKAVAIDQDSYAFTFYSRSVLIGSDGKPRAAFCLDHSVRNPDNGSTLSYKGTIKSAKVVSVLANGYGGVSPSVYGLSNSSSDLRKYYLATQMAVWQAISGTSDTKGKSFSVNGVSPNGSANEDLVNTAKKVANQILAKSYNPSFSLDSSNAKVDYNYSDTQLRVGPYKVKYSGYVIGAYNVALLNAPSSAKVVTKSGAELTKFTMNDEFYVVVNKSETPKQVEVKVTASANEFIGVAYTAGSSLQNYGYLDVETITVNSSAKFTWEKKQGNLKVLKKDDEGNIIKGVKFELRDSTGKTIKSGETNDKGILEFNNINVGTYKLVETYAPAEYIISEKEKTVTIKTGETAQITVINTQKKAVIGIYKIDKDTQEPLDGVKFRIWKYNDKTSKYDIQVEDIVTGKDGWASTGSLDLGVKYAYQEIETKDGYILDSSKHGPIEFTSKNRVAKYKIENEKIKGSLEVTKVDDSNNKIEGVVFQILDVNGKEVQKITTGKDGKASSDVLPKGKYTFKEISAPEKYQMDTKSYEFEIVNSGDKVQKTVTNTLIQGKLEITKLDDSRIGIKGVKFNILASDKKTVIETLVTDKNGKAQTKKLEKGTYYYQEVEVPDGYIKDEEIFEFKINENNEVVKREVINQRIKGTLEILKVESNTERPIEGVVFNILDSKKNVINTVTTDKDGKAQVTDLVKGTYYYQEVSVPDDLYKFSTDLVKFKIEENNQILKKTITNDRITGSIEITKKDDEKQPIANVVFEIKNEKGEVVDKITTNEKGIATSTKALDKGKYTYKEISAPKEYIMDNTEYEFEIKNVGQLVKRTVTNSRYRGSLEIIKVDENNTPIKGVKFEILNSEHKKVKTLTTDKDGKAQITNLLPGKYYYKEVSAPDKYVIDTNEYEFDITVENLQLRKTVVNKLATGSLKIVKIDKETRQPIEGVTFQVLDENKQVIETLVTDKDGIATSKQMILGKYYYKEISAPDKYIVDSKEYSFKLDKNAEIVEKTVTNESHKLPVTGGFISLNTLIIIIVSVVAIAGFVIVKIRMNRRNS